MGNGEWGIGVTGKPVNSYRDLDVWRESMALAAACYRHTQGYPKAELFGLTSQIRRASSSVPANIAEGHGREHTGSFIQFLRIAQGSLKELETHLFLSQKVGITSQSETEPLIAHCETVGRVLRALVRALQKRQ
jgi:four helix bundle protein